jgi:hypothetical protein
MKHDLSEIMLEREFEAHDADGNVGRVILRVGKPQLKAKTNSQLRWYCPHQIVGIGSEGVHAIPGMDAMDALLTSLRLAHNFLKHYAHTEDKKITWLGEEHLGLPELEVSDEGAEKDDKLSTIFENAFNEFFRNLGESGKDEA